MKNGGWFQKIKGCSAFRAGHTLMFLGMLFCGACAGQQDTSGEIAQAVKAGGIINIEDTGAGGQAGQHGHRKGGSGKLLHQVVLFHSCFLQILDLGGRWSPVRGIKKWHLIPHGTRAKLLRYHPN